MTSPSLPLLSDGRIRLRAVEPSDLDLIMKWENDSSLWSVGVTVAPFSRRIIEEYIASYTADIYSSCQLRLMVELIATEETVGMVDLYDFSPVNLRAGVGVLIDGDFSRRGIGLASLLLLERYCFERLGIHSLYATIPQNNLASRRLFEKAGYRISGRLRSWLRHGSSYADAFLVQRMLG